MQYLSLEEHTIMTNHSLNILKIERDEIEKINQEQKSHLKQLEKIKLDEVAVNKKLRDID